MKRVTAALLLGAAVFAPVAWVRADSAQSQSGSRPQGSQSSNDDAALIEFLGGIGSEDDGWIAYLARTDPTKVASRPKQGHTAGSKPPGPPHASADSSSGSEKN